MWFWFSERGLVELNPKGCVLLSRWSHRDTTLSLSLSLSGSSSGEGASPDETTNAKQNQADLVLDVLEAFHNFT